MNVREIEQAARFAWPALEEEELSFGVLRYASGSDRRANSLSLHPDVDFQTSELIEATEKFFNDRDAAPVVRLVRGDGSSLKALAAADWALECRGYEKQSPTLTMLLDMRSSTEPNRRNPEQPEYAVSLKVWLRAWYELTSKPVTGMAVHESILGRLEPNSLMLLNRDAGGLPLSTGMGVLCGRAVGVFGVATAAGHRQRGHALELVNSLLVWASAQGVRYAYLQVEESNEAAIKLYKKLGFTKIYSYWYRVGKQAANS